MIFYGCSLQVSLAGNGMDVPSVGFCELAATLTSLESLEPVWQGWSFPHVWCLSQAMVCLERQAWPNSSAFSESFQNYFDIDYIYPNQENGRRSLRINAKSWLWCPALGQWLVQGLFRKKTNMSLVSGCHDFQVPNQKKQQVFNYKTQI